MSTTKSKSHRIVLAAASIIATMLVAPSLKAESADGFVGTYRYTKSFDDGRGVINRAFNTGIDSITPILRPLIRSRVFRQELMVSTFSISETPEELVFRSESPRTWTWGLPQGVSEEVTTPIGSKASMVHRIRGDRYVQQFHGRIVDQTTTYRLLSDRRRLRVDTTVRISIADEPIQFTLFYIRAGS